MYLELTINWILYINFKAIWIINLICINFTEFQQLYSMVIMKLILACTNLSLCYSIVAKFH